MAWRSRPNPLHACVARNNEFEVIVETIIYEIMICEIMLFAISYTAATSGTVSALR